MVANPNSTMLLKSISLLNLEINIREHGLSFFLISFFQAGIKVPIVSILQTLVYFLIIFFLLHSHMPLLYKIFERTQRIWSIYLRET
jgi:hypothetical protein